MPPLKKLHKKKTVVDPHHHNTATAPIQLTTDTALPADTDTHLIIRCTQSLHNVLVGVTKHIRSSYKSIYLTSLQTDEFRHIFGRKVGILKHYR